VVEVVVPHRSVSTFPLWAALGVSEIWTYDGSRLVIYGLRAAEYAQIPFSRVLRGLNANQLSWLLELGKRLDSLAWPDEVLVRFRHPK
jgi:hypothetical protein